MQSILAGFDISMAVMIDLLIVIASVGLCCLGYCLGSSIRKHEFRLEVLSKRVDHHDIEIDNINTRISKLTKPSFASRLKKVFAR
jgi:hypothetical protein